MTAKSILIWLGVIVVTIGAIVGLYYLSSPGGGNGSSVGLTLTEPVSASDWRRGPDGAKAVLVEYSDFQCPACASYESLLQQLSGEFGNSLQFVYREFPLRSIHQNADLAARAAEAAGVQGKFWEMHDKIFQTQADWSKLSNSAAEAKLKSYAQALGVNMPQFASDLNSPAVMAKINNDISSGNQSGIQGTPTFFLNGKDAGYPQGYEEFKAIIQKVL